MTLHEYLQGMKGKTAAVIGLGVSNRPLVELLARNGVKVIACDRKERAALGGKVFDILGRVTFEGKTLRDLLLDAIRYGDDPEVRARLNQVVDASLDTAAIKNLLKEYALTSDVMDVSGVNAIREDMERMEARKLEPHFIQAFFMAAMKRLGGRVEALEFLVTADVPHLGESLASVRLQPGILLACISRGAKVLFPGGGDSLQTGDTVIVIAPRERHIAELRQIFDERG